MRLESLANELFLEIFEYVPVQHLFRTFHNLNVRLNTLLIKHIRTRRLDFRCVSKLDFDTFCEEHLPLIVDRISSLRLSDEDETPQQIHCFLSRTLNLSQFISLQSLSLSHLRSSVLINQLMIECQHLLHLTNLHLIDCSFRDDHQTIYSHLKNLWTLPKLKHCHMDIYFQGGRHLYHYSISRFQLDEIFILLDLILTISMKYFVSFKRRPVFDIYVFYLRMS